MNVLAQRAIGHADLDPLICQSTANETRACVIRDCKLIYQATFFSVLAFCTHSLTLRARGFLRGEPRRRERERQRQRDRETERQRQRQRQRQIETERDRERETERDRERETERERDGSDQIRTEKEKQKRKEKKRKTIMGERERLAASFVSSRRKKTSGTRVAITQSNL